jgi:ATP-dependent exoDNAse (exonuclease V) alpha subunit
MAIYHFSAKVISRANGSSAVASAAYRAAERLHDDRLGRDHDFSNKAGVVHSEIMLPEGAPERLNDRATLWNEVEAGEKRKDAQLAREVEFSIPREMNQAQGVALARDLSKSSSSTRHGRGPQCALGHGQGRQPKPHAHVMLSMREVGPEGFGQKVRDWNSTALLQEWREAWADHVNERLAELDIDARIDHRTLEAQGIELEPQHKIGPAASRRPNRRGCRARRGSYADRAREWREDHRQTRDRARRDHAATGDVHDARPGAVRVPAQRRQGSVRPGDGAVRSSPELVALGRTGRARIGLPRAT